MELLTPNELSHILRLHPFTVTRLAREGLSAVPAAQAGKLPAFKVGGVWRFRKDQFEKWVDTRAKRRTIRKHNDASVAQ